MAIKVKLTLVVPEYNANGAQTSTNVLPGGSATGEGDNKTAALAAIDAVLEARQASNQSAADLIQQIRTALST